MEEVMEEIIDVECPKCHKISPFKNPNFCSFCGQKFDEETKKKYTRPVDPSEIQDEHRDE